MCWLRCCAPVLLELLPRPLPRPRATPLQELAAAGILDPAMEAEAAELATVWETQTAPFFEITVPAAEVGRT